MSPAKRVAARRAPVAKPAPRREHHHVPLPAPAGKPRGYSYTRYSTVDQAKGASLERQTEAAQRYCREHGLELDTELSLHDSGVSAYRGRNSDVGALAEFLEAARSGIVPPGSFLLVESFDRLSREVAYDAQLTLQSIIQAGIIVVTLNDGKRYSLDILRADPMSIIYMVLLMSRANEESATKSKRVADAWQRNRAAVKSGRVISSVVPGWVRVPRNADGTRGKPEAIPERALVVRRIFDAYIKGAGKHTIARQLNADRVPTFTPSHRIATTRQEWTPGYVFKILQNRAVLGEYQPMRMADDGSKTRVPTGEPNRDYFPRVIDATTFQSAQLLLETKAGGDKGSVPTHGTQSMLAQLAVCPRCGSRMTRVYKGTAARARPAKLICTGWKRAAKDCIYVPVDIGAIHDALVSQRDLIAAAAPGTDTRLPGELAAARDALGKKQAALDRLLNIITLEVNPPAAIVERIRKTQAERDACAADVEWLEKQVAQTSSSLVAQRVSRLHAALTWHQTDDGDIVGLNAAMRECFESVVVDYASGKLVMHWRHGPPPLVLDVPAIKVRDKKVKGRKTK